MNWQPIETAPKDGTRVLVANSHGAWMAEYSPVYGSGYRRATPWFSVMLNHEHIHGFARSGPPTHWMPLPEPPQ